MVVVVRGSEYYAAMDDFYGEIAVPASKPNSRYSMPKGRESREKSVERMIKLPVGLLVLMASAGGPTHGTELVRRIIGDTMGRVVDRSTLYDELARLEAHGLVSRGQTGWKKQVEITPEGERRLKMVVQEMQLALEVAKKRQLC